MAVPKFEDFKAPWETDAQGNPIAEADQVVDKAKLKTWIHALLGDKDKAQTARDTANGKVNELTTKVTELEGKLTTGDGQKATEIQQLMAKVTELAEANKKAEFKAEKMQVLTSKGFDPTSDFALFEGKDTIDAVNQYADLLIERGLVKKTTTDSGGKEGEGEGDKPAVLDGKPPAPLNNGLPGGGAEGTVDVKAFLAQYSHGNPL